MKPLNFAEHKWTSPFEWCPLLNTDELPLDKDSGTSALCVVGDTQIAVFRSAQNKLFASQNLCGHRIAFVLSEGTVEVDDSTRNTYIACPLHRRKFFLEGEQRGYMKSALSSRHSIATFPAKEHDGRIWVKLPSSDELDAVLGTHHWKPQRDQSRAVRPGMMSSWALPPRPVTPTAVPSDGPNNKPAFAPNCESSCPLDIGASQRPSRPITALSAPESALTAPSRPPHRIKPSNSDSESSKASCGPSSNSDQTCPAATAEALLW